MRRIRLWQAGLTSVLVLGVVLSQGVGAVSASPKVQAHVKGPIKITQITSPTGAYQLYGIMQEQGFKAGLAYATHGTNKVLGAKIQVSIRSDVNSATTLPDPTIATQQAKAALQGGANIIQCCASSVTAAAVAQLMPQYKKIDMVAPAADDSLTGINKYTFRTSREDTQDAMTGAKYAYQKFGKTYMTMAQDFSFGQNQENVWNAQLKHLGAKNVGNILFPLTATSFTSYINLVKTTHPKWLFVACAGLQCGGLFNQLKSAGLFKAGIKVMTGLPNVAAIPGFGAAATKMGFMSVYYYTFPHTAANTYLKKYIQSHYKRPADIFDQDSFAAAQQIVAAIQKAKSLNTNKLIKALQGQTVQGPKGAYTIRAKDHVCIQPMYITRLKMVKGALVPVLLQTIRPVPPVVKMK